MEVITRKIECNHKDKFYVVPLGDIHYGTINCEKGKFEKMVDWIEKNKEVYWVGLGDYAEFINFSDKRFDPKNIDKSLRDDLDDLCSRQTSYIASKFWNIKDRCLGLLDGNHEESIRLNYHFDVTNDIISRLNSKGNKIPRLGWNAFIKLIFLSPVGKHKSQVTMFVTHGYGGGHTIGGKVTKLVNLARDFEADIYCFGHVHEKLTHNRDIISCTQGSFNHIVRSRKCYALTGTYYNSYKKGNINYSEKKLYPPGDIGSVKITIKPFRTKVINGKKFRLPPDIHVSE